MLRLSIGHSSQKQGTENRHSTTVLQFYNTPPQNWTTFWKGEDVLRPVKRSENHVGAQAEKKIMEASNTW